MLVLRNYNRAVDLAVDLLHRELSSAGFEMVSADLGQTHLPPGFRDRLRYTFQRRDHPEGKIEVHWGVLDRTASSDESDEFMVAFVDSGCFVDIAMLEQRVMGYRALWRVGVRSIAFESE